MCVSHTPPEYVRAPGRLEPLRGACAICFGAMPAGARAALLGITGAPGAGKSTLAPGSGPSGGPDGRLPLRRRRARTTRAARPQGCAGDVRRGGVRRPARPDPRRRARRRGTDVRARPGAAAGRRDRGAGDRNRGHRGQLPAARRAALAGRARADRRGLAPGHSTTAVRVERLVARHVEFGKSPDEARAWVDRVDAANALLVEAARDRADVVVDLSAAPPRTPPA